MTVMSKFKCGKENLEATETTDLGLVAEYTGRKPQIREDTNMANLIRGICLIHEVFAKAPLMPLPIFERILRAREQRSPCMLLLVLPYKNHGKVVHEYR